MIKKTLLAIAVVVVFAILGFATYVGSRQHLTYDAPYPEVAASSDSAVVLRGQYVVHTLANCWMCHGDPARQRDTTTVDIPLSGGYEWKIPPGEFFARNITPDSTTGIGAFIILADSATSQFQTTLTMLANWCQVPAWSTGKLR